MIAPTAIINGLGFTLGLEVFKPEGTTGDYHSNFSMKGKFAVEKLEGDYDFCFLHIKAVDDAGHDKSFEKKKIYLEKVDNMLGEIIENYKGKEDVYICVTGDHTTPISVGDHTYEPVPVGISRLSKVKGRNEENGD